MGAYANAEGIEGPTLEYENTIQVYNLPKTSLLSSPTRTSDLEPDSALVVKLPLISVTQEHVSCPSELNGTINRHNVTHTCKSFLDQG